MYIIQKRCVSQQNVVNKLEAERVDLRTISILLKKFVTTRVGLKIAVKDEPNFFFEKEDFLKNGYGYDFETFTNGFLAKNCIRINRHLRTKFFPPKLEI